MSGPMNRASYRKLIDEDIAWLDARPDSLERQHVRVILQQSEAHEYDCREAQADRERLERELADLKVVVGRQEAYRKGLEQELAEAKVLLSRRVEGSRLDAAVDETIAWRARAERWAGELKAVEAQLAAARAEVGRLKEQLALANRSDRAWALDRAASALAPAKPAREGRESFEEWHKRIFGRPTCSHALWEPRHYWGLGTSCETCAPPEHAIGRTCREVWQSESAAPAVGDGPHVSEIAKSERPNTAPQPPLQQRESPNITTRAEGKPCDSECGGNACALRFGHLGSHRNGGIWWGEPDDCAPQPAPKEVMQPDVQLRERDSGNVSSSQPSGACASVAPAPSVESKAGGAGERECKHGKKASECLYSSCATEDDSRRDAREAAMAEAREAIAEHGEYPCHLHAHTALRALFRALEALEAER